MNGDIQQLLIMVKKAGFVVDEMINLGGKLAQNMKKHSV
jgi:hypothetical protein